LWQALWFIVAIGVLVAIHEYGHFWVARKLGFKVQRFSIGFGKPLLRKVGAAPDHTEYVLAAVPLGGYVKLLDEREGAVPTAELHRSFTRKHPWQRILVLLAGPGANIAFAIAVLWAMMWAVGVTHIKPIVGTVMADSPAAAANLRQDDEIVAVEGRKVLDQGAVVIGLLDALSSSDGASLSVRSGDGRTRDVRVTVPDLAQRRALTEPAKLFSGLGFEFALPPIPTVIGELLPDSAAAKAGLQVGDRIVSIDGERVNDFAAMRAIVAARPDSSALIEYQRDGRTAATQIRIGSAKSAAGKLEGRIGVVPAAGTQYPASMQTHVALSPLAALGRAVQESWTLTVVQAKFFVRMLTGQVSLKNLSGPISIAEYAGSAAKRGPAAFLSILVMLSLSLGFLNLLPIPLLDGGQIVYASAEWIKGSPLSEGVQAFGQQIGIALLVLLMGMAFFNDISRTVFGG
jgi:regulator of sigma E protease